MTATHTRTWDPAAALPYAAGTFDTMFTELRDHNPVWWYPETAGRPGFWVVTRYDDCAAVMKNSSVFSSERGNGLSTLLTGGDPAGGMMLPVTDGERHSALRKLMMRAFTPRFVNTMQERVRQDADRRIAAYLADGGQDFARDVSDMVPATVICDMFDIPESDRAELLELTGAAMSVASESDSATAANSAKGEILFYFADLIESRRGSDDETLLGLLTGQPVQDAHLTDDEIVLNCYSLLLAGDETSRLAISGAVQALATHESQWQRLLSGAVELDSAVEEVLRWTSPTVHAARTTTAAAVVGEQAVAAGELVSVWTASANRDERQFESPFEFDLGRTPNRHLAFAHGPHYCLGAFLARMEIGAVLGALRERVRAIEFRDDPQYLYSNFFNGYRTMPVALTPA